MTENNKVNNEECKTVEELRKQFEKIIKKDNEDNEDNEDNRSKKEIVKNFKEIFEFLKQENNIKIILTGEKETEDFSKEKKEQNLKNIKEYKYFLRDFYKYLEKLTSNENFNKNNFLSKARLELKKNLNEYFKTNNNTEENNNNFDSLIKLFNNSFSYKGKEEEEEDINKLSFEGAVDVYENSKEGRKKKIMLKKIEQLSIKNQELIKKINNGVGGKVDSSSIISMENFKKEINEIKDKDTLKSFLKTNLFGEEEEENKNIIADFDTLFEILKNFKGEGENFTENFKSKIEELQGKIIEEKEDTNKKLEAIENLLNKVTEITNIMVKNNDNYILLDETDQKINDANLNEILENLKSFDFEKVKGFGTLPKEKNKEYQIAPLNIWRYAIGAMIDDKNINNAKEIFEGLMNDCDKNDKLKNLKPFFEYTNTVITKIEKLLNEKDEVGLTGYLINNGICTEENKENIKTVFNNKNNIGEKVAQIIFGSELYEGVSEIADKKTVISEEKIKNGNKIKYTQQTTDLEKFNVILPKEEERKSKGTETKFNNKSIQRLISRAKQLELKKKEIEILIYGDKKVTIVEDASSFTWPNDCKKTFVFTDTTLLNNYLTSPSFFSSVYEEQKSVNNINESVISSDEGEKEDSSIKENNKNNKEGDNEGEIKGKIKGEIEGEIEGENSLQENLNKTINEISKTTVGKNEKKI